MGDISGKQASHGNSQLCRSRKKACTFGKHAHGRCPSSKYCSGNALKKRMSALHPQLSGYGDDNLEFLEFGVGGMIFNSSPDHYTRLSSCMALDETRWLKESVHT